MQPKTSARTAAKPQPQQPRSARVPISYNNQNTRTKSSDQFKKITADSPRGATKPNSLAKPSSNSALLSSKSLTDVPAVNHPNPTNIKPIANHKANFFGPQYTGNPNHLSNVYTVETQAYNYGVFKQPTNKQVVKKRGYQSVASARQRTSSVPATASNNKIVAADIYVFARKRPKLSCESNFNDVVVVEPRDKQGQAMICVNEMKAALDGTPILKKVRNCFLIKIILHVLYISIESSRIVSEKL